MQKDSGRGCTRGPGLVAPAPSWAGRGRSGDGRPGRQAAPRAGELARPPRAQTSSRVAPFRAPPCGLHDRGGRRAGLRRPWPSSRRCSPFAWPPSTGPCRQWPAWTQPSSALQGWSERGGSSRRLERRLPGPPGGTRRCGGRRRRPLQNMQSQHSPRQVHALRGPPCPAMAPTRHGVAEEEHRGGDHGHALHGVSHGKGHWGDALVQNHVGRLHGSKGVGLQEGEKKPLSSCPNLPCWAFGRVTHRSCPPQTPHTKAHCPGAPCRSSNSFAPQPPPRRTWLYR